MPIDFDDFNLTVRQAIPAEIFSATDDVVGSGAQFTIDFQYIGGLNPAATAFEVDWYGSATDRNNTTNKLTGAQAPSGVAFNPSRPNAGGTERPGSLTGRAPTLSQSESQVELFGRLTIVQAALNA